MTRVLIVLLLAGCSQVYAERDNKECTGYGLNAGTPEYAECRVALKQMREQRRDRSAYNYHMTRALTQPTKPVNCYRLGNTVSCY